MNRDQLKESFDYDDFSFVKKIGEGTYGVVKKVEHIPSGKFYAIKEVKMDREKDGIPSTTLREIAILKNLDHPNVVKLHGVVNKGHKKIALVFEFMDEDLKGCSQDELKSIIYQLLLGINYCHSKGVLHRDLKPNNILINKTGEVKVSDFGLARKYYLPLDKYTREVITLWYRPPEILLGQDNYFTTADIWSIGCMMYELVHGEPLFSGDSELGQLIKIFQLIGTPSEENWPGISRLKFYSDKLPKFKAKNLKELCPKFSSQACDLFSHLIDPCPENRIDAIEALKHAWFDDLDKSKYADPDSY
jgi:cyclin-dependent kinase 2